MLRKTDIARLYLCYFAIFVFGLTSSGGICQATEAICDGDSIFSNLTFNSTIIHGGKTDANATCSDYIEVRAFNQSTELPYICSNKSVSLNKTTYTEANRSCELMTRVTPLNNILKDKTGSYFWISESLVCDDHRRTRITADNDCPECTTTCCEEIGRVLAVRHISSRFNESILCPQLTSTYENKTSPTSSVERSVPTKLPQPKSGNRMLWVGITIGSGIALLFTAVVICKLTGCCTTTKYEEVPYAEPSDVIGSSSAGEYSTPYDARQSRSGIVKIKPRVKSKKQSRMARFSLKFRTGSKRKTQVNSNNKQNLDSGYSDIKFDGEKVTINKKESLRAGDESGYMEVKLPSECVPENIKTTSKTPCLENNPHYSDVTIEKNPNIIDDPYFIRIEEKNEKPILIDKTDDKHIVETTGKHHVDDSNPYDIVIPFN